MNPVVTARVPEDVRDRGVEVLRSIGSNTSELVNAAFDYVIREKKLPGSQAARPKPGTRSLSSEQAQKLTDFMDAIHVSVPADWDSAPCNELLDRAMEGRHANLR